MRKLIDAEMTLYNMKLRQMGAEVKVINSKMCYVKFDLGVGIIRYVYNVNKKGKYYLERVEPYPLPLREVDDESDVFDIIEVDLEQFKNVATSEHIDRVVEINRRFTRSMQKFEDLFLYYDIPKAKLESILSKLDAIDDEIQDAKEKADRIYFKKEPEFL